MKQLQRILIGFTSLMATLPGMAFTTTKSETLRVWAEFPEMIIADGKTVNYIKVYEHDDADIDYTAFNMEFILPAGFKVNKVMSGRREVNDISLSERADVTHTIACNIVDGVDLRIFCDSSENADFFKDDEDGNPLDELFTIGLICEPTLSTGDYEVRNEGIKFVLKTADACIPANEPILYTIHVDRPTAVDEVTIDELDPLNCYDLQGRPVDPTKVHGVLVVCKGHTYYIK